MIRLGLLGDATEEFVENLDTQQGKLSMNCPFIPFYAFTALEERTI